MKSLLIVLNLTLLSSQLFSQDIREVKTFIEDLVINYQPQDYSYEMGYGDSFSTDFLQKFIPEIPQQPGSILILERCSNSFNLCRRNFLDLKGLKRILIKQEQGYVTLRFLMNESSISLEYVNSLNDGWQEDKMPDFPPMLLLGIQNLEVANKLKKVFIFLSIKYGGRPIDEDLF